jgi:hypothetical protein
MKAERFLLKVWAYQAQPDCYFFLSTKAVQNGRWQDHVFQWPVKRSILTTFFKKYSDKKYHLYFCPLPFKEKMRRKELVLSSKLLWSDLDEAHPKQCDPVPQIAWQSSPNRYSALWILNDSHTPLAIEPVNKGLSYSSGADTGGWDLTQVLRIPGMRNQKYDDAPKAELMWFTDNEYRIEDIPAFIPQADPKVVMKKYGKKLPGKTRRLLLAKRATIGKRSDIIWRLENELSEAGLKTDEIYSLIKGSVWNKFAGRKDEDRQLRRELSKIEERKPALLKPDNNQSQEKNRINNSPVVRMSDVAPESVSWLWYPYLPKSKLTIIEGDPGVGKSWITLSFATHLSRRRRFPGATTPVSGKVLLLSAEDGHADTIRPRLDQLKANPRKIFAWKDYIILDEVGLEEVEEQIERYQPKLVIIDPLVAYMGSGIDLHKANEIRELTAALASIAERHKTAIIGVRHLRKGGADKSIYRGLGSIDLTAAARSVLLVGKDPNNPELRAMAHIKCNIAELGKTQLYSLHPSDKHPFQWRGESDLTSDEILAKPSKEQNKKGEEEQAHEFLEQKLLAGWKKRETIVRESEARSINKSTLLRVMKNMKVREEKRRGKKYWALD